MTSGSPTTAPVRQPTRWHGAWYFQPHGWRTFLLPRFVLPSRRQIPLTAAIHFGLGTAAMAMNTIRAPFAWRRRREPVNVLFVGRHHLGDFLMTLPAMRLARRGLPSARMTVVIQERYRHQLDLSELQLETIPEIEGLCFWSEVRAWRDRLREGRYDAVVFHRITRPDFPAILAAFLENVPHRVGGGDKGLQAFLTDVYCPDDREPVVTYHWNLVAAWLRLPHAAPELQWPDVVALPGVEKRWDLLIAPFAQHTKEWPVESWHALLRHALDQNLRVALSASPGESARAAALIAPFPAVVNLAGPSRTLGDLFRNVKESACVIAVDTGIRHVAAALGVPCVVLGHGREHFRIFGAYVPTERYLFHRVPCAPCGAEPCPLGHLRCIREISVSSALDAWHSLVPAA